jgi:hypothetical protein
MIAVIVEKSYGTAATVRVRVRAASVERARRLVFPIDPEAFFAAEGTREGVEVLPPVENEEVMAA